MKSYKRYTVTAALPYANGPKHIGHLAGAYIPADVYARYLRLREQDVIFVCGSDEHGTAIPNQALRENSTPRAIIDKYHDLIHRSLRQMGISFDIYHRTSEEIHHQTAQDFFLELKERDVLFEKTSEQYYDEQAGAFLADRYIVGTCPRCGHDHAYGDQCEKCGSSLSPDDLINPRSTLTGKIPVKRPTKHWYLPLEKYEPWLRKWILENHRDDWKPNVYGQCKSWIDGGLQPRAMTRDLDWGVRVPLPGAEGKVLYVWFDAPIGYLSATRALFQEMEDGKTVFATPQSEFKNSKAVDWKKYWMKEDTKLVHFIGKDNIVFHCIIFPVMLHAHGEFILPDNVPANEFMNLEKDKMSTSRGWSIEMHEYLEDFPDKVDVLRYVLLTNLPETKDSEFTWKDYQARNNNELVAILGNFINRAMVLTQKNFGASVPDAAGLEEVDKEVLGQLGDFPDAIGKSIDKFRFREAVALLMDLARLGNKYLAETEPWKLPGSKKARLGTILNCSLQIAGSLAILAKPFLPSTAQRISDMLGLPDRKWKDAGNSELLKAGHHLGEAKLLFEKIDDKVIEAQLEKLETKALAAGDTGIQEDNSKREITYDDFARLDLRTGIVREAERVEKSKKLLKLTVETIGGMRTILSGIAESYTPEQVKGMHVVLVANLAPRKMMGYESEGMILMAEDKDGKLVRVTTADDVAPGSPVN